MEIKEPIHELVIELFRGTPWHELLDHEADLFGIDHRLGRNWPAGDGPKPLGQDDGFPAKLSASGPRVPLHNDRPTIATKKFVSPGLAAAQPPDELKRLPSLMSEQ
jgi:hypothetical protein